MWREKTPGALKGKNVPFVHVHNTNCYFLMYAKSMRLELRVYDIKMTYKEP